METKKFIIGFMDFYDYPDEAKDTFINAFDTIENSEFKQAFYELADKYLREVKIEKSAFISETIKDIATQSGIHKYTLKFLLLYAPNNCWLHTAHQTFPMKFTATQCMI